MRLTRGTVIAGAGLAIGGAAFALALQRALTLEPVDSDASAPAAIEPDRDDVAEPVPLRTPSQAVVSREEIAYAVAHDPFQPDREQAEPFRFPDEIVPRTTPAERTPPPEFRMTGVVGGGDGGLAVIETDGMTPQILSLGESVLGYRLERVGATSATLAGHGETLELQLVQADPKPGANGSSARPFRLPTINVNGRNVGSEIQRALQQAQRSGMSQAAMQALFQNLLRRYATTETETAPRVIIRRDVPDAPSRAPDNR